MPAKTVSLLLLTPLAMPAFAANSVLCRLAMVISGGEISIDAVSFAAIRMSSGAVILAVILVL